MSLSFVTKKDVDNYYQRPCNISLF